MPPTGGDFTDIAPPDLTPNTRSEAEEALRRNSLAQTDSAAPTSSAHGSNEAQQAYHQPHGMRRTNSAYATALEQLSQKQQAEEMDSITTGSGATVPLPAPGEGVVPLRTGVGAGQAEVVEKARPRGLSLGMLGRIPSWNEQDKKHLVCGAIGLMEAPAKGDKGYDSGADEKGVGGV
ncbi:uncharacterized protein EI97DRAFT_371031 [Westerdykella ornata]|uniref:Uncharacterized protein n=1 Tax=Westerdykella ornata TaxID=318751 RepID=A0A6A6JSU4_WESOR|nr:uncharacterized protein EI97DRAFT_371031 [Westerdykella ornata]KAF2279335.1 hypothetical protein EI97DRAFT_371031 [Westerdykella ornata]